MAMKSLFSRRLPGADTVHESGFEVCVQRADFDIAQLQSALLAGSYSEGAIATFTGYVRATNEQRELHTLELEHYPGMTEKSISAILAEAAQRWYLLNASVVHRIGKLRPGDQIVWVGIASVHRESAFSACEFVMDYLKTRAPFWTRELGDKGAHWVDARDTDNKRAVRWQQDGG